MFVRNEDFRSFLRLYPIVSIITGVNLFLWIFTTFLPGGSIFLQHFIGYNAAISQGEIWRLVTPIFLHGSFTHVLFNSFSLVLFGPALERMIGKGKFITAYLVAGTAANIATFFISSPFLFHLGASGAIYGLFGIYLYMVLYRKDLIDANNAQLIITILVIGLILTFLRPNINITGHIFGFISGAAIAPLILGKKRSFSYYDHDEISFDPNRWKKRKLQLNGKTIIWGIFIVLIILGLVNRFI
ncbi:rhomboid family intramembrane serine protease [Bacillus solimangrovi]|uniref:Rhomboid family intramembrane serine protease n=1 Tax=Bacillus solimangrovi TaxID=1305675 RepID=A0A1E5LG63_9BACI|nr:rhomboid family intramembrane serine protease [Bacillus solimangrovi]OEH93063.1 rhomboid family intramembrane serine protease [Bacillus solimangrovi]